WLYAGHHGRTVRMGLDGHTFGRIHIKVPEGLAHPQPAQLRLEGRTLLALEADEMLDFLEREESRIPIAHKRFRSCVVMGVCMRQALPGPGCELPDTYEAEVDRALRNGRGSAF